MKIVIQKWSFSLIMSHIEVVIPVKIITKWIFYTISCSTVTLISFGKYCSAAWSTMLFTHSASSWPISTFTPFFFMLTPTVSNVSKFSWFPSLSSWRRRNFLGKRFTFLATRELLVQLKLGCFSLSSAPFCILLLTNNLLPGRGGWGAGLELWIAHPVEKFCWLAWSFAVSRHVLNAHVEFLTKGRKVCFPLPGPQNVRKARYLCGWILGSLLVKRSNFLIQQVRRGNCPLTQGGSCQNKHIGDNVSQLVFLSCSFSTYFPPLPFRHFLSCMCQQQHRDHYFRHKTRWWGWMRAHDRAFENIVIMAVRDPVLLFSTAYSYRQTQVMCSYVYPTVFFGDKSS